MSEDSTPDDAPPIPEPGAFEAEWRASFGPTVHGVKYLADSPLAPRLDDLSERHPGRLQIREDRPTFRPPDENDLSLMLVKVMPRSPQDNLSLGEIGERLGWPVEMVQEVVRRTPGVVRLDDWQDPKTGDFVSNGYYLDAP